MYSEFYPQIFTALGYPCNPYDGKYRWHNEKPNQTIIAAVENLPMNMADFLAIDLTAIPELSGLVEFQKQQKIKERQSRYEAESDPLYASALYDSIRTDGKAVPLKDSEWAKVVAKIKAEIAL